jgi:hypothetical protein
MNRLTEKISNEILVKNKNGNGSRSICYGCDGISNCTTRVCNFYRAMEKLAAYEDTGLEPEQIKSFLKDFGVSVVMKNTKLMNELKEYKNLEEQGRLKRFHKIGDEVHILYNASGNDEFPVHVVNKCKVKYQYSDWLTDKSDMSIVYGLEGIEPFSNCTIIDFEVWEDDIFSTKEEAEKALEEMK